MDVQEQRERVWKALSVVARPDSRFHFDFSSFSAFGSLDLNERLLFPEFWLTNLSQSRTLTAATSPLNASVDSTRGSVPSAS